MIKDVFNFLIMWDLWVLSFFVYVKGGKKAESGNWKSACGFVLQLAKVN